MPPNPALNATELTRLQAQHQTSYFGLGFEPDTVVGTATVATTPTEPIVEIDVSGASAGWTNQRAGQMVKITSSDGLTVRGHYRNRVVGDATHLYVDEVTQNDADLFTFLQRTTDIQAGDIATIIERYPLASVKPNEVAGTLYQDWNIAVGTYNTLPDDASYNVTINGQPGDYACQVGLGQKKALTVALVVTPWPTSSGAAYTYSWTTPAAATGVSGAATATLSLSLPVGSYHLYCDVTDSITGRIFTIVRWVRIFDPSDPPLRASSIPSDTRDRSGRTLHVRLVQGVISSIPVGAKCILFSEGIGAPTAQPGVGVGTTWGGADVSTATHTFVGFLYQQPFQHSPSWYESEADLISPAGVLDMLYSYALTLQLTTGSTWLDLPSALCTVGFAQWWILRWRVANFLNQFNFTPLSTASTVARRTLFSIAGGISIFQALTRLALMYNSNIGSRSDGELIAVQNPSIQVDRAGLVTRATLDDTIYSKIQVTWLRRPPVGAVNWTGVIAGSLSDAPYQANWPGNKAGQGGRILNQTDVVFDSTADGAARAGNAAAYANNPYPKITLDLPTNWDVFEPADMEQVIVNVPAKYSPTGVALSLTACPISVTKKWLFGAAQITLELEGLTQGMSGTCTKIPAVPPTSINPPPPNIPPAPTPVLVPPDNGVLPTAGFILSSTTGAAALITSLSPSGLTFDPWSTGITGSKFYDGGSNPYAYNQSGGLSDAGWEYCTDVRNKGAFSLIQTNAALFGAGNIGHRVRFTINRNGCILAVSGSNALARSDNLFGNVFQVSINGLALDPSSTNTNDNSCDLCPVERSPGHWYAIVPDASDTAWVALYRSTNFGVSWSFSGRLFLQFSITGRVWIEIPYTRKDGVTPNIDDSAVEILVYIAGKGSPYPDIIQVVTPAGAVVQQLLMTYRQDGGAANTHPLSSFTYNSSCGYTIDGVLLRATTDQFATVGAPLINLDPVHFDCSCNGWSPNPLPVIGWSPFSTVAVSLDGATFAAGIPSGWGGTAYAEFSLSSIMP